MLAGDSGLPERGESAAPAERVGAAATEGARASSKWFSWWTAVPIAAWRFSANVCRTAAFRSQLLALSRNFGSFAAIAAGMAQARGETHRGDGGGPAGAHRTGAAVLRGPGQRARRHRLRRARQTVGPVALRARVQPVLEAVPQVGDPRHAARRRRRLRLYQRGPRPVAGIAGHRYQPDRAAVLDRLPPRVRRV